MFLQTTVLFFLTLSSTLVASVSGCADSSPAVSKKSYLTGNATDVIRKTTSGFLLAGGGTDQDEAMQWMIRKSGGGDFVVLRASGEDGYNSYIYNLGKVDSVETLLVDSRSLASDAYIVDKVQKAEAIFIAGGAQDDYVNYWQGTPLQTAINKRIADGVPVGGTSAGLAVLGEYVYSALNSSAVSSETLENPYNIDVTLAKDFLRVPLLAGLITDSHFVARDRMGRLLGFMARIAKDGWTSKIKAIAIDEDNAVAVESNGSATLFGEGTAYFLSRSGMPETCESGDPLTYTNVSIYRMNSEGSFNLNSWQGSGGKKYTLSAERGTLSSSNGSVY